VTASVTSWWQRTVVAAGEDPFMTPHNYEQLLGRYSIVFDQILARKLQREVERLNSACTCTHVYMDINALILTT
jgi:hypothetical protein